MKDIYSQGKSSKGAQGGIAQGGLSVREKRSERQGTVVIKGRREGGGLFRAKSFVSVIEEDKGIGKGSEKSLVNY